MNTRFHFLQKGFTLPELLVVMVIAATLLGIITLNLASSKQATDLSTTVSLLTTDMQQQQLKAMVGDTEGRMIQDAYGIHFDATSYTLFNGTAYTTPAPTDIGRTINLGDNIEVINPNLTVIFATVSGEVIGYPSISNTIVLRNVVTGAQKTVQFNRYGVVANIN